jgi:uncharacterized protein (TIGR03435 family)
MIRRLLADRFRLVMRVENKMISVYALTVASGGPKLQKSAIAEKDCIFDTSPKACHNFVGGLGHRVEDVMGDHRSGCNRDVLNFGNTNGDLKGCEAMERGSSSRGSADLLLPIW